MALTLPLEVLSNMKVSFNVGLSDGTFAFDMAPMTAPPDMVGLQPESGHGMKLHLCAVAEAGSVVLTLSTSGQRINRIGEESMLDATSQSTSGRPGQSLDYSASNCIPDHAADHDCDELAFMTHPQTIMAQEPLDPAFQTLPLLTFDSQNGLFDLQAAQSNFDNLILDSFTLEYNHCDSDVTSFSHHEDGAGFTGASSDHDFTGLSDTGVKHSALSVSYASHDAQRVVGVVFLRVSTGRIPRLTFQPSLPRTGMRPPVHQKIHAGKARQGARAKVAEILPVHHGLLDAFLPQARSPATRGDAAPAGLRVGVQCMSRILLFRIHAEEA
ncbi:hypothetical protein DFH09DRAFT_1317993 [Mycena vulgaris]|nr:hypothetical protein DFH09DRAFT_1317993 [Mycena vulgaris]